MVCFCFLSRISRTDLRHMVTDAGFFQDVRLSCLSLRDTGLEIGWLDTPSSIGLTTKPSFPYLQMGAWKRSFWVSPSPVSCPAFVVWQNNKPRVVIDLRRVNAKSKTGSSAKSNGRVYNFYLPGCHKRFLPNSQWTPMTRLILA